jgi:hypothetical protein
VWLELLQCLFRVVDEREAGALATTILCSEPEHGDLVLLGLVQFGELDAELVLGDVWSVGVEDIAEIELSVSASHNANDIQTYTTICLRARRGFRMNLRVRRVTGASDMIVVCEQWDSVKGGGQRSSLQSISEDMRYRVGRWEDIRGVVCSRWIRCGLVHARCEMKSSLRSGRFSCGWTLYRSLGGCLAAWGATAHRASLLNTRSPRTRLSENQSPVRCEKSKF